MLSLEPQCWAAFVDIAARSTVPSGVRVSMWDKSEILGVSARPRIVPCSAFLRVCSQSSAAVQAYKMPLTTLGETSPHLLQSSRILRKRAQTWCLLVLGSGHQPPKGPRSREDLMEQHHMNDSLFQSLHNHCWRVLPSFLTFCQSPFHPHVSRRWDGSCCGQTAPLLFCTSASFGLCKLMNIRLDVSPIGSQSRTSCETWIPPFMHQKLTRDLTRGVWDPTRWKPRLSSYTIV